MRGMARVHVERGVGLALSARHGEEQRVILRGGTDHEAREPNPIPNSNPNPNQRQH